MKDAQMRKYNKTKLNARHSRFMGTYVVQNMKSINDENKLIVHKAARNMDDLLDDSNKKTIRKAKNKIVVEVGDPEIAIILNEIVWYFLFKTKYNLIISEWWPAEAIGAVCAHNFEEFLREFDKQSLQCVLQKSKCNWIELFLLLLKKKTSPSVRALFEAIRIIVSVWNFVKINNYTY